MVVVATNLTYFLANWFLDPRANYLQLRPPRSPEQIDRALAQYDLSPGTPLLVRWWQWLSNIVRVIEVDRGWYLCAQSVR